MRCPLLVQNHALLITVCRYFHALVKAPGCADIPQFENANGDTLGGVAGSKRFRNVNLTYFRPTIEQEIDTLKKKAGRLWARWPHGPRVRHHRAKRALRSVTIETNWTGARRGTPSAEPAPDNLLLNAGGGSWRLVGRHWRWLMHRESSD